MESQARSWPDPNSVEWDASSVTQVPEKNAFVRESIATADIVHVFGEVDFSTAETMQEAINATARPGRTLIVDLEPCSYLDSTGLTVLVRARDLLLERLWVVAPEGRPPRRVLDLTRLSEHLHVVGTIEAIPGV